VGINPPEGAPNLPETGGGEIFRPVEDPADSDRPNLGLSSARTRFALALLIVMCATFFAIRAIAGGIDGWAHQAVRLVNLVALAVLASGFIRGWSTLRRESVVLLAGSV
jgi:hypothetical protein